jgi:hypothetical protein
MNAIQRRQLEKLNYVDPESLLVTVRPTVVKILNDQETVKREKKENLEQHHAACLGIVMGQMTNLCAKITICVKESEDYDCVLKTVEHDSGNVIYRPVQLKMLPNRQVLASANVQDEIDKLKKYEPDVMVSFWINRDIKIEYHKLRFDKLRLQQLWFIGVLPSGETLLHGGIMQDWRSGRVHAAVIKNGKALLSQFAFYPCRPTRNS